MEWIPIKKNQEQVPMTKDFNALIEGLKYTILNSTEGNSLETIMA